MFWTEVNACLDELQRAATVDDVIDSLHRRFGKDWAEDCAGDAFFPGSGGDRQLRESLTSAGWTISWSKAPYYYVARDTQGGLMTYCEGDVYRGDRR